MSRLVAAVSATRTAVEIRGTAQPAHEVAARIRAILPQARVRVVDGAARLSAADAVHLLQHEDQLGSGCLGPEVVRFVRNRITDIRDVAAAHALREQPISAVRDRLAGARLLGLLDDHQVRNVGTMTLPDSPGACVFDEQGTGKTLSVVAAFDLLVDRSEVDVMVVVAPKSMVGEWAAEIGRFTGGLYRVAVLDGPRRARAAMLSSAAEVFVGNYESLLSIPEDYRLLCTRHRVLLVADESFAVKNPDARRTDALARLREWCTRAYALCGTPAPNDAADVVAQVTFVDFGRAFGSVRLPDEAAARRSLVKQVMENSVVYTRNLKSVVLPHLPGRVHTDVDVVLAPRQRELYARIAGDLARDLERISDEAFRAEYANYLARRAALLRTCSDPRGVEPNHDELPAKFDALDALLARWTGAGEKVVLWSFYRNSLDRLEERYRHLGVVRVDGSVADVATRRAAVRAFQESDDVRVFVGNPAAAGAGITLHAARIAVYESMSNQAAHYLQSLDRIHRRGQKRDVEYVTLACAGTIEQDEYRRLRTKAALQADLLGDPEPERVSRAVMLEELLASLERLRS